MANLPSPQSSREWLPQQNGGRSLALAALLPQSDAAASALQHSKQSWKQAPKSAGEQRILQYVTNIAHSTPDRVGEVVDSDDRNVGLRDVPAAASDDPVAARPVAQGRWDADVGQVDRPR